MEANAALPGATIGGHKVVWEQNISIGHDQGGTVSQFGDVLCLQWGPMRHCLVLMRHCLVLLVEAISWSGRVVPHSKNLPFATREVTETKYYN